MALNVKILSASTILVVIGLLHLTKCSTKCVIQLDGGSCPKGENCSSLRTCLERNKDNVGNLTILFLEGSHFCASKEHFIYFQNLTLCPYSSPQNGTQNNVVINLCLWGEFEFRNVSWLIIKDIDFTQCLDSATPAFFVSTNVFYVEYLHFSGVMIKQASLIMRGKAILFENCHFNILKVIVCTPKYLSQSLAVNLTMKNSIMVSTLIQTFNDESQEEECSKALYKIRLMITNCTIVAQPLLRFIIDFRVGPMAELSMASENSVFKGFITINIKGQYSNATIKFNQSVINTVPGGISITLRQGRNKLFFSVFESIISGSSRLLIKKSFADIVDVAISKTLINTSFIGFVFYKKAVFLNSELHSKTFLSAKFSQVTLIKNNEAMAITIPYFSQLDASFQIQNCTFSYNGAALRATREKKSFHILNIPQSHIIINLDGVNIFYNGLDTNSNTKPTVKSIVNLVSITSVTLHNCKIIDNVKTGLSALLTDIVISGSVIFQNNTGLQGGAIRLQYSFLYIKCNASFSLTNNTAAEVGGAIFVDNPIEIEYHPFRKSSRLCSERIKSMCARQQGSSFFQLNSACTPKIIYFKNNLAGGGGNDIYGGMQMCLHQNKNKRPIIELVNSSISSVSSDPKRICLCNENGLPQCTSIYTTIGPYFPGEVFVVQAVAVGNNFGTVKGVLHAKLLEAERNQSISLGPNQKLKEINKWSECSTVQLSVQTLDTRKLYIVELNIGEKTNRLSQGIINCYNWAYENQTIIMPQLLHHPVLLKVSLEDCPIGMMVSAIPPFICKCHPKLDKFGITSCLIVNHTGIIFRSLTLWISGLHESNISSSNDFVAHKYCPFDYCKPDNISIDPANPDKQCANNRSGLLCGGCQKGHSLALGSTRCLKCSNMFVLLMVVFIIAGIVLVTFVKLLDLTVTNGTLNGLIFYANILWTSKSIYVTHQQSAFAKFLDVFLAWLNLDFGIDTCFFSGLNGYWKTWLQFVFPVYIWSLTGAIIIASHYSTRASRIFGNNSVPVLATLILLSYTKLLRTIIDILSFSVLDYPNEKQIIVWSFDGNYFYFGAAHTVLLLVAIAVLIFLWLPFTAILLFHQCLRKHSNLRLLKWIYRFKPFFDAYFGQLKSKHHYWIGLLLIIRLILLVVLAATMAMIPNLNILLMVIVLTFLLILQIYTGFVYKSIILSLLENSFIINLILVGTITLYMKINGGQNKPVILYTSQTIAFIVFLITITYLFCMRIKSFHSTRRRRQAVTDNFVIRGKELKEVPPGMHKHMQYREPLLDCSDQK